MAGRVNILAFDTSSIACSVALMAGTNVTLSHQILPMGQARLILPAIETLLSNASLSLNQLDAIAYGCGPGSFTGIRIASGVAQGLGYGASVPIIQLSSLAILAQTAYEEHQCDVAWVAIDARMNQVYWAIYKVNEQGYVSLMGKEAVNLPHEVNLPENIKIQDCCGIGDGFEKYEKIWVDQMNGSPSAVHGKQLPSAQAMLKLAKIKFDKGEVMTSHEALPIYLR